MKKALLIGINYRGTNSELNGCINDVKNVKQILESKYNCTNIKIITDDTIDKPRKNSILRNIEWLLKDQKRGDKLFFQYSGHGSWVYDINGDESDGKDECLVPLDYDRVGMITDDLLKIVLINKIKPGVSLTAIIDACHSGTICDLRHTCRYQNKDNYEISENEKYQNIDNKIITISGCLDTQTSADAYISRKFQGAMTYYLLKVLNDHKYDVTYRKFLKDLHELLKRNNYTQRPVLSSCSKINLDDIFVLL